MEWNASADRSQQMAGELWGPFSTREADPREASWSSMPRHEHRVPDLNRSPAFALPEDSDAAAGSAVTAPKRLVWAWAAPFLYGPPFVPRDLEATHSFIEPSGVYCCPPDQWLRRTKATIAAWRNSPRPAPGPGAAVGRCHP
jgi:hypothetical protein